MATTRDGTFWAPVSSIKDFTLKFEEVIFSLVLSTAFAALSPFTYHYYSHQPLYVRKSALFWAKLVSH